MKGRNQGGAGEDVIPPLYPCETKTCNKEMFTRLNITFIHQIMVHVTGTKYRAWNIT